MRRRVGIESARRVTAATQPGKPAGVCCKCELWRAEGLGTRNRRVLPKDIAESSYLKVLNGRQPYQQATTPSVTVSQSVADHDRASSCHRSRPDPSGGPLRGSAAAASASHRPRRWPRRISLGQTFQQLPKIGGQVLAGCLGATTSHFSSASTTKGTARSRAKAMRRRVGIESA